MILLVLLATFAVTVVTGPAGDNWRRAWRERRDLATARVLQLPAGRCRTTVYQARDNRDY